jgi:hypothetical protein
MTGFDRPMTSTGITFPKELHVPRRLVFRSRALEHEAGISVL